MAAPSLRDGPDLVTTSRGGDRLPAFTTLVRSLVACRGFGGRLIVVDQSPDGAVGAVATALLGARAEVIPAAPCGIARARNLAHAAVRAPVVGFPDDDACYFPDTLDPLAEAFADPSLQALCGRLVDPAGTAPAGMARAQPHDRPRLSLWQAFWSANSNTLFVRHPGWRFAEDLGAGTPLGSGEETDLVCRLITTGGRVAYAHGVRVGHPVVTTRGTPPAKLRSYARGYTATALRAARRARSAAPLAHLGLTAAAAVAGVLRTPHDAPLRRAYAARLAGIADALLRPLLGRTP
ncbi:MAG: glycosyltransferase [Gemmatimonadetes bacterium]|nr:glycosyltransferase [Gemmatimonadota bacterium]